MCAIIAPMSRSMATRSTGRRNTLITFLHGLESRVNADLVPIGRKVKWLRAKYPRLCTPALNTGQAVALRDHCVANKKADWFDDLAWVKRAFSIPMKKARESITDKTQLVIGSSFGGAVLLRLIDEGSWNGPSLFLAGAGLKLTQDLSIPPGHPALFIHGRRDYTVLLDDSRELARSCRAPLWEVEDGHRLHSILGDGTLEAAIDLLLPG